MNEKYKKLLFISAILSAIGVVFLLVRPPGLFSSLPRGGPENRDLSPSGHDAARGKGAIAIWQDLLKSPIELYGHVEDQHGAPVPGATVTLSILDHIDYKKSSESFQLTTDAKGDFSVKGRHGASMGVSVTKQGYIHISPTGGPSSSMNVGYGSASENGNRYRNPKTPLVLRLQNPGAMEPLVHVPYKRWRLTLDGVPRDIALDSENGTGSHRIEFRLWSNMLERDKPGGDVYDAYDWTFEARIPGGGFVWNDSDLNFEAPETGYKEMIRYHLPKSMPRDKWRGFRHGRYFVRFSDGTHGRISFDIDAGTEPEYGPLELKSWFNPKSGSRNLASEASDGSGFSGGDPEKEQ